MAKNTFTPWLQTDGSTGHASNTFPINNGPEPWFRDKLDAARSARIPSAEYPDGYLGTTRTRREDRVVAHGGTRQTKRSYERGIHVGSRVEPEAYFWTDEVNPQIGLALQARGRKFAPKGEVNAHLVNDGKPGPVRGSQSLQDPATLERLRPRW